MPPPLINALEAMKFTVLLTVPVLCTLAAQSPGFTDWLTNTYGYGRDPYREEMLAERREKVSDLVERMYAKEKEAGQKQ